MASFIYNSAVEDLANNEIDFGADDFKIMLVTDSYSADKDDDETRDDVTNEITGTGYTAGGESIACTVTKDTANDKVTLAFASTSWSAATITAAAAVIYKDSGATAADDNLVAYIDFGGDVSSTSATFTVGASTITLQN